MKEWEVTFADKTGEPHKWHIRSEQCPSKDDVAQRIRSEQFPVLDRLDLNDFLGRTDSPTARSLKEHSGVDIISILELP